MDNEEAYGVLVRYFVSSRSHIESVFRDQGNYTHKLSRNCESFIVYTPTRMIYPAHVVMILHDVGGNADIMLRKFRWDSWADAHGVMIVSPNGTIDPATNQRARNAGICCVSGVDDVGFLGTVVRYIQSHYKVNPDRFFVWVANLCGSRG